MKHAAGTLLFIARFAILGLAVDRGLTFGDLAGATPGSL